MSEQFKNPLGAKYVNSIIEECVERSTAIAKDMIDQLMADGYAPTTKPLSLADLKLLPREAALAALSAHANVESTYAASVELAAKYLQWEQREAPIYA